MLALKMDVGDLAHARVQRRIECLDKRRLADSGNARKEGHMALAGLSELIHALSGQCRNLQYRIARTFVDFMERLKHFSM